MARIKAGRFVGTKSELRLLLANIAYSANLQAVSVVTTRFAETIAQEWGTMRGTFIETIFDILNSQKGKLQYTYEWPDIKARHIAKDEKAQYHYDGTPYHPGKTRYDNPTTPGTFPMFAKNFIPALNNEGAVRLRQLARNAGIELR